MTGSKAALMRRLTVIMLVSTFLLVSASMTFLATPISQVPVTDGTTVGDYGGFSSGSSESTYPVGSFSVGLQQSAIVSKNAPPQVERLLVVKAKLSDKEFVTPMADINVTMINGVRNYYGNASYSQVAIVTTVIPINYTMPGTELYYAASEERVIELVQYALTAADDEVNQTGGYSVFRHIIVVHSGQDQAMPPNDPNAIASQFIYRAHAPLFTLGGVQIMNACVVSDRDPLGVVVHELGHSMGLPDLYNSAASGSLTGDDFLGSWELMAEGAWNPSPQGTSPSYPTTWSKIKLGWINSLRMVSINQTSIQSGQNLTVILSPEEWASGTAAIRIQLNNGTYYLVEVRQKIGYDAALPTAGVLILYCNDSKPTGKGPVRLMSGHPPDLGPTAPYNVGIVTNSEFFGDRGSDIGVRVLNKWADGTFKILVGQRVPVYNARSEYVGSASSLPIPILAAGCIAFVVIVIVIYLTKGRQKTQRDTGTVPVIKLGQWFIAPK